MAALAALAGCSTGCVHQGRVDTWDQDKQGSARVKLASNMPAISETYDYNIYIYICLFTIYAYVYIYIIIYIYIFQLCRSICAMINVI